MEKKLIGEKFGNLIVTASFENRAGEEVAVCYCLQCGKRVFDVPVAELHNGWQHDCPKYDYYERIQQKFPSETIDKGGRSIHILWGAACGHHGSMEKVLEELPGPVHEYNGAYMWKTKSGVWHCIGKTATAGMKENTTWNDDKNRWDIEGYDPITELYFRY